MSFFEKYKKNIEPKLRAIDIFLKENDYPLPASETAKILDLSNDEVFSLVGNENIGKIDKHSFLTVMRKGSSSICGLFRRELDCGSPKLYKADSVAYIYELDKKQVEKAFSELYITEVTGEGLAAVFLKIPDTTNFA